MSTVVERYKNQRIVINLPGLTVLLKTDTARQVMAARKQGPIAIQPGVLSDVRSSRWNPFRHITGPAALTVQQSGSTYANGGGISTTGDLNGFNAARHAAELQDSAHDVVVTVPRGVPVTIKHGTISNPEGIPLN